MIDTKIDQFLTTTLPSLKVAIIGDIMIDRYVFGDVSRISPEAPVPVNRVNTMKDVLGGAGNVAANLANLDCTVYVGGVAGEDDHSQVLRSLLQTNGINDSGILYSDTRSTITKMRILGDRQQMMRLDFETVQSLSEEEEERLVQWFTHLCENGLQGLVISDYGKGVCTPSLLARIIPLAQHYHIPVIVDPKGSYWSKYNGVTCVTPNVKELGEVVGYTVPNEDEAVVEAAKKVLAQVDLAYLVVTRSAQGITVVSKNGRIWHNPATKQDVFDVSGAGDTVVAILVTCLATHLTMRMTLHMANMAAGIVVAKVGTYPIHRYELLDAWKNMRRTVGEEPYYSWTDMAEKIRQWQANGETVVFTNGVFDIVHSGHIKYLLEAAQLGQRLVIGLNSDSSVKRLKGDTRPIISERDRAILLSALGAVDGVVLFEQDTPFELLERLRPNILVKGGDYRVEEVIGKEWVDEVRVLSFKDGYSTTSIVNKIATMAKEGIL